MKALILHSDDLGASRPINRGIFAALESGRLSSASIMVNMPASLEAIQEARNFKSPDSFGLHLNLTEGFPLSPRNEIPDLVDFRGRFLGPLGLMALLSTKRGSLALRRQWRTEMERQFAYIIEKDLPVSHLNGHHYIETFPQLTEDILGMCTRFGIRAIRTALDPTPPLTFARYAQIVKLPWAVLINRQAKELAALADEKAFVHPRLSLGVGMAGKLRPKLIRYWQKTFLANTDEAIEIIFHIKKERTDTHVLLAKTKRKSEEDALDELHKIIQADAYSLCNYSDLSKLQQALEK